MRTHKILIKSKDISDEQIKELASATFERKPPSDTEKKHYRKSLLKNIGLGIALTAVGIFLLGFGWLFRGGAALILGVLFFVSAFSDFSKLYRDVRKTKPEDAIRSFLESVLIGDDSQNFGKKSEKYAYDSLCRMVPDFVPFSEADFTRYIQGFRAYIKEKVTGGYDDTFLEEFREKDPAKALILRLAPGKATQRLENAYMYNVEYSIEYSAISREDKRKKGTAAKSVPYARFVISFEVLLINSDKFWFLSDPLPEITLPSSTVVLS
jgi:hypothetical protein